MSFPGVDCSSGEDWNPFLMYFFNWRRRSKAGREDASPVTQFRNKMTARSTPEITSNSRLPVSGNSAWASKNRASKSTREENRDSIARNGLETIILLGKI